MPLQTFMPRKLFFLSSSSSSVWVSSSQIAFWIGVVSRPCFTTAVVVSSDTMQAGEVVNWLTNCFTFGSTACSSECKQVLSGLSGATERLSPTELSSTRSRPNNCNSSTEFLNNAATRVVYGFGQCDYFHYRDTAITWKPATFFLFFQ